MKKLFEAFTQPTNSTWKELLVKELKSNNPADPTAHLLELEELLIENIYEQNRVNHPIQKQTNDWEIGVIIPVVDCKQANTQALRLLNTGVNALNFEFSDSTSLSIDELLAGIEVNFIHCYFTPANETQENQLKAWFENKSPLTLQINNATNLIDTFPLHALGANATQEIAYALSYGNKLLNNKSNPLHFRVGIGTNFFVEIAKSRAFSLLWNRICVAQNITVNSKITAQTGFTNKSLKDPYTNLLRLTTEGLSAILGGIDQLIIQPYDLFSQQGSSEFSERMAINTSLILKEESEINQLLDPFAGSFVVEKYTESLCDAAWKLFQKLEALGGYDQPEAQQLLSDEIKRIRTKRIEKIVNKQQTLVGINNYPNPDSSELRWKSEIETFLGMEQLVLERDFDSAQ